MQSEHLLAADVGGTKTTLIVYLPAHEGLLAVQRKTYASRHYDSFHAILDDFLSGTPAPFLAGCLGVAGPVLENRCRTTNLPWVLDGNELGQRLGAPVRLLNDLEAMAWGMLQLPAHALVDLNTATPEDGNQAVIAAGTGLGQAIVVREGTAPAVIATEGGHSDFAPSDATEDRLLAWLRKRHPAHVSWERVVSGPGLVSLYCFLRETGAAPTFLQLGEVPDEHAPVAITEAALRDGEPLCEAAVRLFCRLYGAQAGNLALQCMARGGVYLGGGIAPAILPFLRQEFMPAFCRKGRFEEMLRRIPVWVATDLTAPLLGAAWYAAHRIGRD